MLISAVLGMGSFLLFIECSPILTFRTTPIYTLAGLCPIINFLNVKFSEQGKVIPVEQVLFKVETLARPTLGNKEHSKMLK